MNGHLYFYIESLSRLKILLNIVFQAVRYDNEIKIKCRVFEYVICRYLPIFSMYVVDGAVVAVAVYSRGLGVNLNQSGH